MTFPILEIISSVCRRLNVEPFLVGGPVRDRLLGRTSHDWDLVCPKAHQVARAVAQKLSKKVITLDEQHKIYRIVHQPLTLDFAERQGKTMEQDLSRRDFTINAIACPLNFETLIDPFQGQKDLKKKLIRAVSRQAFKEDPLRLLRAFRFAAQLDFTIEPRTRRWIAAEHRRLEAGTVARERVREELLRLLSQKHAAPVLFAMDQCGLLTAIFPELEAGRRVGLAYYGKGGVVKHHLQSVENVEWLLAHLEQAYRTLPFKSIGFITEPRVLQEVVHYTQQSVGGFPRTAFLKLGVLLHDVGKPATAQVLQGRLRFFGHEEAGAGIAKKILEKLRFSKQESQVVRSWVQNHMRPGNLASVPKLTDKAMARFFRDMSDDGVGMLIVSLGDHYTYLAKSQWTQGKDPVERTVRRLLEGYYIQREKVLPPKVIDGYQLMKKLRLKPGPVIGQLLSAIQDAQSEARVSTPEEAIAFARQFLRKKKK